MFDKRPLNALRAFAVAARDESFKAAADELHVTAGAVSRQVKELESRLGTRLFERHPRGVALNATGRRLAASVEAALAGLAEGYAAAGAGRVAARGLSFVTARRRGQGCANGIC